MPRDPDFANRFQSRWDEGCFAMGDARQVGWKSVSAVCEVERRGKARVAVRTVVLSKCVSV